MSPCRLVKPCVSMAGCLSKSAGLALLGLSALLESADEHALTLCCMQVMTPLLCMVVSSSCCLACFTVQEDEGWPARRGGAAGSSVSAERDPPGSRLYTASQPGVWRLKGGSLRLDEASQLPPLMLVGGVCASPFCTNRSCTNTKQYNTHRTLHRRKQRVPHTRSPVAVHVVYYCISECQLCWDGFSSAALCFLLFGAACGCSSSQCTDLDGTLIEDGESSDWLRQNDELTRLAAQHFHQYLSPAGGLIVFNTGRSIGMVEGLLARKAGIMPWPAAIITAVGTKVFVFDVANRQWVPDPAYSHLLDEGWNLAEVRTWTCTTPRRGRGGGRCATGGRDLTAQWQHVWTCMAKGVTELCGSSGHAQAVCALLYKAVVSGSQVGQCQASILRPQCVVYKLPWTAVLDLF